MFWKWSHPLPGSRAFTKYVNTDPRINTDALKRYHDPLPIAPDEQNALWFKWYREFQMEPSIKQVHREYLFARDYAGISLLLVLGLGTLAFRQMESVTLATTYVAILLVQYLLVCRASRTHGVRFVTSVLACKASGG